MLGKTISYAPALESDDTAIRTRRVFRKLLSSIGRDLVPEDQDALWDELMRLMAHHQKRTDATPLAALNRIFRELVPPQFGAFVVDLKSCKANREQFSWEQLSDLVRKDTTAMEPSHVGDPIIVVAIENNMYVVDGRRRVNRWVAKRCSGYLEAIVVQCRS